MLVLEVNSLPRPQKETLRPLTDAERELIIRISQSTKAPAQRVLRARGLLAVSQGKTYTAAAQEIGVASGDTIATWVRRFNLEGSAALVPRRGGGRPRAYSEQDREAILTAARHHLQNPRGGNKPWTLSSLRQRLLQDELAVPSSYTLWNILREARLELKEKGPRHNKPARALLLQAPDGGQLGYPLSNSPAAGTLPGLRSGRPLQVGAG